MKGCFWLLFVFLANVFGDRINVKKSENYDLTVPGASFKVEVCRTDAIKDLLFCYESSNNEDGNIGCGTGFCGAKLYFAASKLHVNLNGILGGTTHSCEIFEISESSFVTKNTNKTSNCEWKLNKDGELMLKVVEFPSGWDMTIKDVTRGKSSQSAASLWWAYLIGVVGGLGLVGVLLAVILWLVKKKSPVIQV
uniref:Uncharacterized protein n=1 Tax=Panagrolaimus sp. JU765 TaxID=591449 RepID=A0AC34Q0E6_9BILA